jgi:hypothetical protein
MELSTPLTKRLFEVEFVVAVRVPVNVAIALAFDAVAKGAMAVERRSKSFSIILILSAALAKAPPVALDGPFGGKAWL